MVTAPRKYLFSTLLEVSMLASIRARRSRTAPDRLRAHSTLLKVLGTAVSRTPDKESGSAMEFRRPTLAYENRRTSTHRIHDGER